MCRSLAHGGQVYLLCAHCTVVLAACRDDPTPAGLLGSKHGAQPVVDSDEEMIDFDVRSTSP